jgi:hypothetical protein
MLRCRRRSLQIASGHEQAEDEPEKNEYSHPHDALQYVATKIFGGVVRGSEKQFSRPIKYPTLRNIV